MNEGIFFLHTLLMTLFLFLACKIGKVGITACFGLSNILSNLFIFKQITLFGLTVTACDVYSVGALFAVNLMLELYGKKWGNKMLSLFAYSLSFFFVMSQLQLLYAPSPFDHMHGAYAAILQTIPRISIASFVTALITQKLDIELFDYFQRQWKGRSLFTRMAVVTLICQLFDTTFFTLVGLWGKIHSPFSVIFFSFCIKTFTLTILASLTRFIKLVTPDDPLHI